MRSTLAFLLLFAFPALADTLAIRNVTVIDGTGAAPRAGQTVVVRDGRIAAIAPNAKIPRGARVIDGTGRYLIPGLWDMHVHLAKAGGHTLPLFVANGVTSVRDLGGEWAKSLAWRADVRAGKRIGPRIVSAGPILESAKNIERMRSEKGVEPFEQARIGVGTVEEAEAAVARVVELGGELVKVRTITSPEVYRAIAAAAKKRGLQLAGHAVRPPEELLEAGHDTIEHPIFPPLSNRTEEERAILFAKMKSAGMAIVPTLVTGERSLFISPDEAGKIVEDRAGEIDARRKYLGGYLISDWREQVAERKAEPPMDWSKITPLVTADLRDMHRAGVTIMPGTDIGVLLIYPGFTLHDELELLVRVIGMTPMEALVAATRTPAEFLGKSKTLGTIAAGKTADLVLLRANPLDDIRNTRQIEAVVANGTLYDRAALDVLLAGVEAEAKQLSQ